MINRNSKHNVYTTVGTPIWEVYKPNQWKQYCKDQECKHTLQCLTSAKYCASVEMIQKTFKLAKGER